MGTVHGGQYIFLIISCSFLLRLRNISDRFCIDNQTTHFISSNFSGNPAVCEVMWKNIVEPERPQMTLRRVRISRCIPKATNALSEYVLYLLLLHCNFGYMNARQCYIVGTLPVLCILRCTTYSCSIFHFGLYVCNEVLRKIVCHYI